MTALQIDYTTVYRQLPVPGLLLTPEFVVADANEAYMEAMGRTREDLLGRDFFAAVPDNPSDPGATGVRNSIASLRRVLATGEPDDIGFQKYDVEVPGSPGPVRHAVLERGEREAGRRQQRLCCHCYEHSTLTS